MRVDPKNRLGRAAYLLGLLLVGLASGFLTCCTARLYTKPPYTTDSGGFSTFGLTGSPLAGVIFGLVLSVYFQVYKSLRTIKRVLGLVGASILADFTAGYAGYAVGLSRFSVLNLKVIGVSDMYATALIVGGFVGAAILFLALWFLLAANQSWSFFSLKLIIYSLTGSFLAVLGWALAPSLGAVLWHTLNFFHLDESTAKEAQESNYAAFYSLYAVWQSGMAVLLGGLLPTRREAACSPEDGSPLMFLRLRP